MKFGAFIGAYLVGCMLAAAADSDKQFVFHSNGADMLVFIKPRKIPATKKGLKTKPLSYDITISTQIDSITVAYTLISPSSSMPTDSIFINNTYSYANEKIYIEPKSKNWEYRLRCKLPIEDFRKTFCCDQTMNINIGDYEFLLPNSKQQKEAEINRKALQMIELNKK